MSRRVNRWCRVCVDPSVVVVDNKNDTMEWLYNIAGDIAIRPVSPFSDRNDHVLIEYLGLRLQYR